MHLNLMLQLILPRILVLESKCLQCEYFSETCLSIDISSSVQKDLLICRNDMVIHLSILILSMLAEIEFLHLAALLSQLYYFYVLSETREPKAWQTDFEPSSRETCFR